MQTKSKTEGFTLIELLIVVAIIGILAAIVFPSYQEYVRESRRADASVALMGLAGAMERHFTVNGTYVGAASGAVPSIYPTQSPIDGSVAYYNLTVNPLAATTYTVNAVRIAGGGQAADKCGTLTLTQDGTRGVTSADAGITAGDCWK